jgi:3-oxoacyl-[acyl-carrier protein] reductase
VSDTDLEVVLITGGGRGIGAAIARRVAGPTRQVIINYKSNSNAAAAVVSQIEATGGRASAIQADVSDRAQVDALFGKVGEDFGGCDVLVNNAAPEVAPKPFARLEWSDLSAQLDTQVKGSLLCTQRAIEQMKVRQSGHIIAILSSFVLNTPPVQLGHYVTAKYALMGLMRALATEVGRSGIRVNMLSPYVARTDMLRAFPERFLEILAEQHPMKRLTPVGDIAGAVAYLLSAEASYLDHVNLPIHGGMGS